MSTTVNTSGTYNDSASESNTSLPGTVTPPSVSNRLAHSFTAGSGSDQVAKVYAATIAFAAAPVVINLFDNTSGTQVTDLFGTAFAFTAIRKIYIKHKGTTDNQPLKMGYSGTTANAWTAFLTNPGQISIEPSSATNDGGLVAVSPNTTGWPVSTSSKLVQFDPGANSFSADIVFVGF